MPQSSEADLGFMRRALELAAHARGKTSPNPMVGAVLVKSGHVVGEGYHKAAGKPHAEVEALRNAKGSAAGSTLYVTLEPCVHHGKTPPCVEAVVEAKVARVVAAMTDPDERVSGKGVAALQAAGIKVEVGVCEAEARRLNEFFVTYHTCQRPFIICKWAMTLDGKIATESGHSRWISNEESRHYVHEIRSGVDAVMVGIGTVLMDNPMLNVRLEGSEGHQPKKIVIDGSLRIPLRAKCLENSTPGQCIIATSQSADAQKMTRLRDKGHLVLVLRGRRALIDLKELFRELHRLEIQSILCEGGSGLNGSLLQARLVDKIVAFVAPKIVGGDGAKSPVSGWGISYMHQAVVLQHLAFRNFGTDLCIEGYVPQAARATKVGRKTSSSGPESKQG